jgi:isopentenyl-diphosphate delta-isomerase
MNNSKVILVNSRNQVLGEADKLEAHKLGLLHRAVSVFIFNDKNELLIQQRAIVKYHSSLLWSNTSCTHPKPLEKSINAAKRCLFEEMGIKVTELFKAFSFIYKVNVNNNLIEYEYDEVFYGYSSQDPLINKDEVNNYKWISYKPLIEWIKNKPYEFTPWFLIMMNKYFNKIKGNFYAT